MIYAIADESGAIKIGKADDPRKRLVNLQNGHPSCLRLVFAAKCTQSLAAERIAHRLLAARRLRGEWFSVTETEAVEAIKEAVRRAPPKRLVARPKWLSLATKDAVEAMLADMAGGAHGVDFRELLIELGRLGVPDCGFYERAGIHPATWMRLKAGRYQPRQDTARKIVAAMAVIRSAHASGGTDSEPGDMDCSAVEKIA